MTNEFGSATIIRGEDGKLTVERADPTILVEQQLWDSFTGTPHRPDDKTLVLDSDGQYRYVLRGTTLYGAHSCLIFDRDGDSSDASSD